MKPYKLITLIITSIIINVSIAQNTVVYHFDSDAAGNRIKRYHKSDNTRKPDPKQDTTTTTKTNETYATDVKTNDATTLTVGSSEIKVYPNPTSDYVKVEVTNSSADICGTVQVYDNMSRNVINQKLTKSMTNLDFRTLAPGLYFIRVDCNGMKREIKIVKNEK
ncbi:MAG: T9SS type A sorting domain-containing protein [Bacteroidota bacterium]|nr:T9SS type A sorting domain-containing protein [Bacteroidota bacterium]